MDCSLPGSYVHGILQARLLEWVAFPFSRGSSLSMDRTLVSHILGRFFTVWATRGMSVPTPPQVGMLESNSQSDGIWTWLDHVGGTLRNGTSALIKRDSRELPYCYHEDPMRRQLSVNQEVGSHQTLDLLATGSWTSQPPERWEVHFCYLKATQPRVGEGNGNPPCLENPMDREAGKAAIHGVTKSHTWLSD